jgi:succinate-semialdehyde dehydrogenase
VSINPATGAQIASYPYASEAGVNEHLEGVRQGYLAWRERSLHGRVAVLRRMAELLLENLERMAGLITSEMGKPIS